MSTTTSHVEHIGDGTSAISACQKVFAYLDQLNQHMQVHSDDHLFHRDDSSQTFSCMPPNCMVRDEDMASSKQPDSKDGQFAPEFEPAYIPQFGLKSYRSSNVPPAIPTARLSPFLLVRSTGTRQPSELPDSSANIPSTGHTNSNIYSYLSRDIPTDLSVFLQGALTKYLIECVEHEVPSSWAISIFVACETK